MKNVVDVIPRKPEDCLYCYKNVLGSFKCKHTKKACGMILNDHNGEFECDYLMPLDDTLRDALKAYTKVLDKKL